MEERELAEEEQDELDAMWEDKTSDIPTTKTVNGKTKKVKKNKRKLLVGEVDNGSEDEWEALKKKRQERKGLHDVVSAPPTFDKVPREIFKVKNGAGAKVGNVPNAVGSLRKREELGEERKTIIDTYREMMAAKRNT
jgi:vacuolar-type H+-ATPase subunit I/STV1